MVKSVIVADDDLNWREAYADIVKDAFPDVHVDAVETGAELTECVLQGDYSLVISDNDMEEKDDGLRALQKSRASGNNIPWYIVSGGSLDVARNALRYGASGFYYKGNFDSDELIADITQHLQ